MSNATTVHGSRTREVPWLGCGTSGSWTDVEEALYYSGLDYNVEQVDVYDDHGTRIPGVLANRRIDNDEILGHTSDQYGVIQNVDAFSLLTPFCKAGGVIEHAGTTEQGMCFMVMRVPGMSFMHIVDDYELYVFVTNSFNTRFPLALIITPVRVYCQNMYRKLVRSDTAMLVKHGRLARDRVLSIASATDLLLDYESEFRDALTLADRTDRTKEQVDTFIEAMFPLVKPSPDRPRAAVSNARIMDMRKEFHDDYYLAFDNVMYEGTRYGLLNAYYDWVTHHQPMRSMPNYEETRFGNIMTGSAVSNRLVALA